MPIKNLRLNQANLTSIDFYVKFGSSDKKCILRNILWMSASEVN